MPEIFPQPVYLERLKVENIRSFESVDIEFNVPESGGQWIVFLGDNGSGKSTLLQLIGLTETSPKSNPFGWDERWANGLVRFGAETGEVATSWRLRPGNSKPQSKTFSAKQGRISEAWGPSGDGRQGPDGKDLESDWFFQFLAGFGTNRADRDFDEGPKKGYDLVASLYNSPSMPSRGPIDPVKWLLGERLKTFEWAERGDMFSAITGAMQHLLPRVLEVNVSGEGVSLTFEHDDLTGDVITVPFASISEGYRATIIWLIDLLAGWLNTQTEENIIQWASEGKLLEAMTGIVLVDELDLHLHPTWQREIVPNLRSLFPNLTFIVTTHSPLIVQSAENCEVFVVERTSASAPSTVKRIDVGATTVDSLLTSDAFGLESELDVRTERAIAETAERLMTGDQEPSSEVSSRLSEAFSTQLHAIDDLVEEPIEIARERIQEILQKKRGG